jgi:hypothetical protein
MQGSPWGGCSATALAAVGPAATLCELKGAPHRQVPVSWPAAAAAAAEVPVGWCRMLSRWHAYSLEWGNETPVSSTPLSRGNSSLLPWRAQQRGWPRNSRRKDVSVHQHRAKDDFPGKRGASHHIALGCQLCECLLDALHDGCYGCGRPWSCVANGKAACWVRGFYSAV